MKIALFGKMRSGKNTVADILINEYDFTPYSFSKGIKEIIDIYFPETKEMGKPREYYQHVGQSLRGLNKNVWINYTLSFADKNIGNTLIDDGRQVNEAEELRKRGYKIIVVISEDDIRKERIKRSGDEFREELFNHETERQVDLIEADVVIRNNGSLEELKESVEKIINKLGIRKYEDLKIADRVKVEKIINVKNKAKHLKSYIGKDGAVLSWLIDMDRNKKYKVVFRDDSTAYFYREELLLLEE